jgi:uncharacterized protein (DUF3084 family)
MVVLQETEAAHAIKEAELAARESRLQDLESEASTRAAQLEETEQALHQRPSKRRT